MHHFDQKLNGKSYPCVQFATRTAPLFSEWHGIFYEDGRKRIPTDLPKLLDPLAMAVWYMDDGSADHCGLTIQTHNFLAEEVASVVETLAERFSLTVNPRKNKSHLLLYIGRSSVSRFTELVGEHVLPELRYKLVPRKVL